MSCNFGCWFRRNSKSFEREWTSYKCNVLYEVGTRSLATTKKHTGRQVILNETVFLLIFLAACFLLNIYLLIFGCF